MNKLILSIFALAIVGITLILSNSGFADFVFFFFFYNCVSTLAYCIHRVSETFKTIWNSFQKWIIQNEFYIRFFFLISFISSGLFIFVALTSVELLIQIQSYGGECAQGWNDSCIYDSTCLVKLSWCFNRRKNILSYDLIPTRNPLNWFY